MDDFKYKAIVIKFKKTLVIKLILVYTQKYPNTPVHRHLMVAE